MFKIEKGGSETLHVGMNKSNLILPKNTKYESFIKSQISKEVVTVLSNTDMCAQVYFNKNDAIYFIEILEPSIVSFKIFNNLFDTSIFDIYKFLKNDGDKVYVNGSGITSNKYLFGLYLPFLSELDQDEEDEDTFKIETIAVFEVGYNDELLKSNPSALHDERLAKLLDQAAGL